MTVFLSVCPTRELSLSLRAIFGLVSLSSLSTLARAPVYKQAHSLYSAPLHIRSPTEGCLAHGHASVLRILWCTHEKYVHRNVCPSGGCAGAQSVKLGMGMVLRTPPRLVGATLYCRLCVLQQLHRALQCHSPGTVRDRPGHTCDQVLHARRAALPAACERAVRP